MLFEILAFYSLFLGFLFVVSEYSNKPALGIIASVLIFPLAAWVLGTGIQIQTGEAIISIQETNVTRGCCEYAQAPVVTDVTSSFLNETTTYTYGDLTPTPYVGFSETLGLILCLLGLYGMFHYAQVMLDKI
jgi:hypothetical protein